MKKKGFRIIKLLIIFVGVMQLSTLAKSPKYFIITGKILSEIELAENITVRIIKNNQPANVSQIPSSGRFRLELDYNAEYQLTFMQNEHVAKTIVVNTEIPDDVFLRDNNFPHFLMVVKLEKATREAISLATENSIQHITYSPQNDNFARVPTIFDVEYVEQNDLANRQTIRISDSKSKIQTYQIF